MIPRPDSLRRIGIFGGAFDPPHLGHLTLAERASKTLALDLVLWTPCHTPPHKPLDSCSPSPETRFQLVEAAIAGSSDVFRACDWEIERGGVSWTIETVRRARVEWPDAALFLLVGADAFAGFDAWREADEIAAEVTFAVHGRADRGIRSRTSAPRVVEIPGHEIEASSSECRQLLFECRDARRLIPSAVLALITEKVCYVPPRSENRERHIAHVESAAVALADRWKLDVSALRRAARWHDAYRPLDPDLAIAWLEREGEEVDDLEREQTILLHGRVAALRLSAALGVSAWTESLERDVIAAVRNHTTGRDGMSPLEETLFVADHVGKDWPTVAAVPLDRRVAVHDALKNKLEKLRARGLPIHSRTAAAARAYGFAMETA